jgi:hypothetical protein
MACTVGDCTNANNPGFLLCIDKLFIVHHIFLVIKILFFSAAKKSVSIRMCGNIACIQQVSRTRCPVDGKLSEQLIWNIWLK